MAGGPSATASKSAARPSATRWGCRRPTTAWPPSARTTAAVPSERARAAWGRGSRLIAQANRVHPSHRGGEACPPVNTCAKE
eukprot:3960509-Prymnesium_polylepis.1